MSTETKQDHRDPGVTVLLVAALAAVPVGALVAGIAALADGRDGALGAAVGAGMVLTVLVSGSFVVHVVSRVMPSASLLVALLTYALQIAVLGAVMLSFDRSGDLGETLHPEWLAAGLVVVTVTWVVAQIWAGSHSRVLLYDLPAAPASDREEAGAR